MKKNTFYALLFCAMLGSCAVIEGMEGNSQDIAEAEEENVLSLYRESETTEPATDAEILEDFKKKNPNATPEEIDEILTPKQRY